MTSASIFPQRLLKVDDLVRQDHSYLVASDVCYYLGEYTARASYSHSPTNNLILNFKKQVDRKGQPEWRYKEQAIAEAATALRTALAGTDLDRWTIVPIPPSRARPDPLYDDRVTRMLQAIRPERPLDIRELVVQESSTVAYHENDIPRAPADIRISYAIDESLLAPPITSVIVADDVLTTGGHFKAVQGLLAERLGTVRIVGLFLARRVPQTTDLPW